MIDTARSSAKTAAYSDLIAGLLDVRDDVATQRFDAEVAAAVASGHLDPDTARRLRWLQRESVRGLVEHARTAVPAAMLGLEQARAEQARDDGTLDQEPADDEGYHPSYDVLDDRADDRADDGDDADQGDDASYDPTPRRLLVAGLTVLPSDP